MENWDKTYGKTVVYHEQTVFNHMVFTWKTMHQISGFDDSKCLPTFFWACDLQTKIMVRLVMG
jgi:hypothetical protein